jgi:hypothetical protein
MPDSLRHYWIRQDAGKVSLGIFIGASIVLIMSLIMQ